MPVRGPNLFLPGRPRLSAQDRPDSLRRHPRLPKTGARSFQRDQSAPPDRLQRKPDRFQNSEVPPGLPAGSTRRLLPRKHLQHLWRLPMSDRCWSSSPARLFPQSPEPAADPPGTKYRKNGPKCYPPECCHQRISSPPGKQSRHRSEWSRPACLRHLTSPCWSLHRRLGQSRRFSPRWTGLSSPLCCSPRSGGHRRLPAQSGGRNFPRGFPNCGSLQPPFPGPPQSRQDRFLQNERAPDP